MHARCFPLSRRALGAVLLFCSLATLVPAKITALVGGRLIDGWGGAPVNSSVILIEGERIKAVGTVESLPVPAGAEVIDCRGMSVLPGLWDCHVHTMLLGHSDYDHWDKTYPARFEKEIMPAAAHQLLNAGVTSAIDLGAPLEASINVRERIAKGEIPGPTLYVSGPFIQHAPYPGTEAFRWGVSGADDARAKVRQLANAGVNVVKLIDQDQMTEPEIEAVVTEAHAHKLPVIAHAHRPNEIRLGLKYGVDRFEHTGLATAPDYPADIIQMIQERTAKMALGPMYWCPTIEGFFNYEDNVRNPMQIEDPAWQQFVPADIVDDIKASLKHPGWLAYYQITPLRAKTSAAKFAQLQKTGLVLLIGTDSGIPMKFHNQSTWRELDIWVNKLGVDSMTALRAATYWPAVSMKVDNDYGTLSAGKYADIIAVKGDVLRYIDLLQRVDLVMKHGQRVK
ncbi:MAG TPA: amidohydrolase family protein [Candidatus Didemnitutus sp.]|nr:amidohydrolase family protein [Candidatus Didemnitutus sp.]